MIKAPAFAAILTLVIIASAQTEEPAPGVRYSEFRREASAKGIKRIAILPPVVVLQFEEKGRLPSPDRYLARRSVARELPSILKDQLEARLELALNESVSAALAEEVLRPVDIYQTAQGANEELRDKRNLCRLEMTRAALKNDPLGITVFNYFPEALKGTTSENSGLAAVNRGVIPQINAQNLARVRSRVKADGYLVLRVDDVATREGQVGVLLQDFKSSRITVSATLLRTSDFNPVWEASLSGHSSTRERKIPFTRFSKGYNKNEDRLALDGMSKLAPVLAVKLLQTVQ